MLGTENYTEPMKLDADALPRNGVSASANHNGGLAEMPL